MHIAIRVLEGKEKIGEVERLLKKQLLGTLPKLLRYTSL